MAKYKNLPGVSLELLDGNISNVSTLQQPVAIVIGRAYSGPNKVEVLIDDETIAASKFGAGSPLLEAAARTKAGGIKSVIAYRVGGKVASLSDFAGTGSLLETTEASVNAANKLRVYVGPSNDNPSVKVLIVFYGTTGSKIVYSNVPSAEVDLGYVKVSNFNNATTNVIGSPTDPVLLSDVITSGVYTQGTMTHTIASANGSWNLTGVTASNFKRIVSVTKNSNPVTGYSTSTSGSNVVFTVATPVDGEVYVITYEKSGALSGATFVSGDDALSVSKNSYYELVDAALREVEGTIAQFIHVVDAPLNEDNVADGSTATDKLSYLNLTEDDGEFTYDWNTTKFVYKLGNSTTNDATLADKDVNGLPIVAKQYNEVNYAHRIGTFCQTVAENDGFILASIEVKAPSDLTVKGVSRFVGVSPIVDATSGLVVANGTGLLGNKFMNGTTTRDKGFFATDTGFPDGNILVDSGNVKIDLGKFLNIVAQTVSYNGKTVSGAAHYLGLIGATKIGESTTNALVSGITLPYSVKKTKLDELTGSGYVTFVSKTDGVHVVSGELATSPASDYQYVSTALIIQDTVVKIKAATNGFVGKGMTQVMVAALKTNIDTVLRAQTQDLKIESSEFNVAVTGLGKISVPLKVKVANELREIYIPLSLYA